MHGLLSSQIIELPRQRPDMQKSFTVHALLSLHELVLSFVKKQPVAGLQELSVQGLLSSQMMGEPAQAPLEQTSFAVQALLSLQALVLLV